MTASGWWRGTATTVLVGVAGLGGVIAAPFLVGAGMTAPEVAMLCFCRIAPTDWGAYGLSGVLLAVLLVSLAGGLFGLWRQVRRTRQTVAYLLLFARPLDRSLRRRLASMGLAERVDLVDLDTPIAFCYGLLRPRILLSSGFVAALTPDQLRALLWHEYYHLIHRDPLKVALGRAGATAFAYLPAVRACYDQYLVEKEVEADAYVCVRQGSDGPLVGALTALLDWGGDAAPALESGAIAGAGEVLETRIGRLLGLADPPALPWEATAASGLILLAVLVLEAALLRNGSADGLRHIPQRVLTGC
jgi:beta-lactamase regulating signal transducer with metallopeptidase domain